MQSYYCGKDCPRKLGDSMTRNQPNQNEGLDMAKYIGEMITKLRASSGYCQDQIADFLGMTRSSLINIEKGRQRVQIDALWKLACVLNCAVSDFFPPTKPVISEQETVEIVKVTKVKLNRITFKK